MTNSKSKHILENLIVIIIKFRSSLQKDIDYRHFKNINHFHRKLLGILLKALDSDPEFEPVLLPT